MKKEPLSIITVKTLLAVIIFAGVGTIIVGGGWLIGMRGKVSNNEPVKVVDCYSDKNCETLKCPHRNELGCTSVDSVTRRCVDNKCVCKCGYPDYDLSKPFSGEEVEYKGKTYIKTDEKYSEYIADEFRIELEDGTSIYFFNNSVYTLYAGDPHHGSYIYYKWIEKKITSEVTISTDKTEYERGETVEITVRNNSDKPILFKGIGQPCFNSFSIGIKKEDYKMFYDIGTAYCITYTMELKSNTEQVFYLETGDIDDILSVSGVSTAYPETYKLKLDYEFNQENLTEEVYSNEFTIKEKSALDPRCSEKVRGIGDCKILRIGYEFDSTTGKCIKEGINGCSFETPFKSLEECQRVCEKNYKKEISCDIEDIKNSKKFESLVITQAMQKDITDEITIYLYFNHKLSDEEIQEIEQFGITIYKDSWIPPMENHPLGFYLAKSKVENICVFDDIDLIKKVASGERTDIFHAN